MPTAFKAICEAAVETVRVSRVGIWLREETTADLRAANLFDFTTKSHTAGEVLSLSGAPHYTRALDEERVVAVRDVRNDPRTAEISATHFGRTGIISLLDAPVRISEKLVAVIRHEHAGNPRDWWSDEIRFAGELADQVARTLSNAEREKATRQLRESDERMSMAADAANLGMWVWQTKDATMWASDKWKTIHGYAPHAEIHYEELLERIHPEDREGVVQAITDALNERGAFHLQNRIVLPNGAVRWLAQSGRMEEASGDGSLRMLGIAFDITDRREAEEAAREVSGKLITAQEDERRRIARDLHDDLNQRLALLSVEADLLSQMQNDPEARSLITDISSRVQELSSEVHKLSYQLHPAKLDQLGLVAATRSFCNELSRQCGAPLEFVHDDIPRSLDQAVALCLYRIVQESLQNVVKHSRASRARVELLCRKNQILLIVSDNGLGFDMAAVGHQAGLGLVGMRERVRLVHGTIQFRSAPDRGTRIEVTVPIPPEHTH